MVASQIYCQLIIIFFYSLHGQSTVPSEGRSPYLFDTLWNTPIYPELLLGCLLCSHLIGVLYAHPHHLSLSEEFPCHCKLFGPSQAKRKLWNFPTLHMDSMASWPYFTYIELFDVRHNNTCSLLSPTHRTSLNSMCSDCTYDNALFQAQLKSAPILQIWVHTLVNFRVLRRIYTFIDMTYVSCLQLLLLWRLRLNFAAFLMF